MKSLISVLFVILVTCFGCGSSDPDPATEACNDFVDVVVNRSVACGIPESQIRKALNDTLECGRFTKIRNESELRGACFAWYRNLTCTQLKAGGAIDASCRAQFTRVAHARTDSLSEGTDAGVIESSLPLVEAAAECADPDAP
jgi:hypothetical protein